MREGAILPEPGRWRAKRDGGGSRPASRPEEGPLHHPSGGPPPRAGEEQRRATIVARARSCIGARFRPHGRDPAYGLDCVGVAAIAFGREAPADYALWGGDAAQTAAAIAAMGFVATDTPEAGDLAMIASGPGQLHLAVLTERGFVHADVGLRRVVETPGRPADMIGYWRER